MSYAKAMKHHANIRKCKKQAANHFGFDSSTIVETAQSRDAIYLLTNIKLWFKTRHEHQSGLRQQLQYNRECIREAIAEYRAIFTTGKSLPGSPS